MALFCLNDPQLFQLFHCFLVCPIFMWNVCDLHGSTELMTTQRCYDMYWNVSHINQGPIWHFAIRTNCCYGISPPTDLLNIIFLHWFVLFICHCFFLIKKKKQSLSLRVLWLSAVKSVLLFSFSTTAPAKVTPPLQLCFPLNVSGEECVRERE